MIGKLSVIFLIIKRLENEKNFYNIALKKIVRRIERQRKWKRTNYTNRYVGELDIRLYLEDGKDKINYLNVTYKRLEKYFERIA